jgi:hypothetical protein
MRNTQSQAGPGMKCPGVFSLAFVAAIVLSQIVSVSRTVAQTLPTGGLMTVTLYSPAKYTLANAPPLPNGRARPDFSRAYFSFTSGTLASARRWDLSYGTLGDWLLVGFGVEDDRSTIKDLGTVSWNDKLEVPVLPPLPELKPGESRYIAIRSKGPARGLPSDVRGAPSARDQFIDLPPNVGGPDMPPRDSGNRDMNQINMDRQPPPPPQSKPGKAGAGNGEASITIGPKNSKRSKPAPVLAPVVLGHLYVIHVVKAQSDFYVLAHVDGFVPADNCTISWKRIPSP